SDAGWTRYPGDVPERWEHALHRVVSFVDCWSATGEGKRVNVAYARGEHEVGRVAGESAPADAVLHDLERRHDDGAHGRRVLRFRFDPALRVCVGSAACLLYDAAIRRGCCALRHAHCRSYLQVDSDDEVGTQRSTECDGDGVHHTAVHEPAAIAVH